VRNRWVHYTIAKGTSNALRRWLYHRRQRGRRDAIIGANSVRGLMLRTRQLVPPLSLHTPDGRNVHVWDFKQKKNLLVVFLDADCALCADFLRRLATQAARLRTSEAVVLAVFLEPPAPGFFDSHSPEIIAGSDMSGRGVQAFLGDDALSSRGLARRGVFVADRYGELFAQWFLRDHEFPTIDEIFTWVEHAVIACDGCATPIWPADV
jgi:peroxiredoxin